MSWGQILRIIIFALLALLFSACVRVDSDGLVVIIEPEELREFSQDPLFYYKLQSQQDFLADEKLSKEEITRLKKQYLESLFLPWNEKPNKNKKEIFWITPNFVKLLMSSYGENLKPYTQKQAQDLLDSMRLNAYPSVNKKAIITKTTSVRVVPSILPRFSTQYGYPIDRWQNSLIFAGTPVLVTHFDSSRRFLHIQSGFVYGWVESSDVAFVSEKDEKKIRDFSDYVATNVESTHLVDSTNSYITTARLGQVFALNQKGSNAKEYELYTYIRQDNGYVKIITTKSKKSNFTPFPQDFNKEKIATLLSQVMGKQYGWGGLYEERDCSALVRDIYALNGIFLPRNSKAQGFFGKMHQDISTLELKEKEEYIITNGEPFYTILWLQGHIAIYIGTYKGRAMVAHSSWAINEGKSKKVLGGIVITDLHIGGKENSLLLRIGAMSNLRHIREKVLQSPKPLTR